MDTLRYLISRLLLTIGVILAIALVFFLFTRLFPGLPQKFGIFSFFGEDILPPPRETGLFGMPKEADLSENLYKGPRSPYVSYAEYKDGEIVISPATEAYPTFEANEAGFTKSDLHVRNLSIYKQGNIYQGMTIIGEAKGTMYTNGSFPVYIGDAQGRIFAVEQAYATEQWSIPGWARFSVRINSVLPKGVGCFAIFRAAVNSTAANSNTQVVIPVNCM